MINTKDKGKVKRFIDERKIKTVTIITEDDVRIQDKASIINLVKVMIGKGCSLMIIEG